VKKLLKIVTIFLACGLACGYVLGQTSSTTTTPTYTPPANLAIYINGVAVDLTHHLVSIQNKQDCTTSWTLLTAFGSTTTSLTPPSQTLPVCTSTPTVTEDGTNIDLTKNVVWIYLTNTVVTSSTVTTY
jgi:hypothetical protein